MPEVAAYTESVAAPVSATTADLGQFAPRRREVVARRVVAAPVAREAVELAQLMSRIPDPYGDRSDPELVDAFVDRLMAGAR